MSLIVVNQFSDEFYVTRSSIHFAIFDHNLYLIHVQAALSKIWVYVCYSGRIGAPNTTDTSRIRDLSTKKKIIGCVVRSGKINVYLVVRCFPFALL